MGEARTLGVKGDIKMVWDEDNEEDVKAMEDYFDKMMEKKFKAYKVDKKGEKTAKEITEFNPSLEKIIYVPPVAGG